MIFAILTFSCINNLEYALFPLNNTAAGSAAGFSIYSERQKYGINSLKIKQNFFQKNLWTGQF
jgi:hypothetical protein